MERDYFKLEIDGEEVSDLYQDLISLEVELDDELAAMFRLRIGLGLQPDGTWAYLDDERFRVWKPATITAGFESGAEQLLDGYITHVRPAFDPDLSQCTLEIWGMDRSVRMDREEKLKAWPNKKDSDIAAEIFKQIYGFKVEGTIQDTEVTHDAKISTIIQRETDMQFLRRLALRNGYECYVEGYTGYFRPPQIDAPPQPLLAAFFGDETNLTRLSLDVDALAPAQVEMVQVDRINKTTWDVFISAGQQTELGTTAADDLPGPGMEPGLVVVGQTVTTGPAEMQALCQSLYDQGAWFVTGEGEIAAGDYGHVLKPRGTVTIKGIGETYSGIYYVAHVTHRFTAEGYTQFFRVKRNALMPAGNEQFSASPELLMA